MIINLTELKYKLYRLAVIYGIPPDNIDIYANGDYGVNYEKADISQDKIDALMFAIETIVREHEIDDTESGNTEIKS